MTNPTPSAAEIEAALTWATEVAAGGAGMPVRLPLLADVLLHLHATIATLTARAEAAEAKLGMTLGVGDGSGQLFVHGDYDSIKAAQEIIFRAEALAARVATLTARAEAAEANSDDLRGVIDNVGEKWLAAVDRADAAETRAEALAARVGELETDLARARENARESQRVQDAFAARVATLEAALRDIRECHVPDMPAAMEYSDLDWAYRHIVGCARWPETPSPRATEAAMTNREAAEQLMRHFFSPGDPQWSSKLGTLTAALDAAERRGLEAAELAVLRLRDMTPFAGSTRWVTLDQASTTIRALAVKP